MKPLISLTRSLPEYEHLSDSEVCDGIAVMINDLNQLAQKQGCIAAAYAAKILEKLNDEFYQE